MRIPLPKMMRHWREREFERHLSPPTQRSGLALWAYVAKHPRLYTLAARIGHRILRLMAGRKGRIAALPLAGSWTRHRDFPGPQARTFREQWKRRHT